MPYVKKGAKRYPKKSMPMREKTIRKVVKKELKKEVEVKFFDRTSSGNVDLTALVPVNPLTGFVRGTGPNNYIGSKIKPLGLTITLQTVAVDPPYNMWRTVIIQDKTTSGISNISTLFATPATPWMSPLNVDFRDTYTVLYDKVHRLSNDGVVSTGWLPKYQKIYIPASKLRQLTFTTAAGLADSGSIWICFITDSALAPNPTYVMLTRLTYQDA